VTTARARQMRRSLTVHEARLWIGLKALRPQGYHFRRQAPFQRWYLDFVCFSRRLAIEVDGSQHNHGVQFARDLVRDAALAEQGFLTLRYWNADINTNLEGVLDGIVAALECRSAIR
jgi:very-short-patch-repair endonuclease